MTGSVTVPKLREWATTFLDTLCTKKDPALASSLMSETSTFKHEDEEPRPRDEFLAHWAKLQLVMPEFAIKVQDMIVEADEDGNGGRVWAHSKITGLPGGMVKESIDMFKFNAEGLVVEGKDFHRTVT